MEGLLEYAQVMHKEPGLLSSTYDQLGGGQGLLYHSGNLHSFAIAEIINTSLCCSITAPSEGVFPLKWVYNTEAQLVHIVNSQ